MIEKVIIDPRSSFQYSSFYVKGLCDLVGKSKISFNIKLFEGLEDIENNMRFILVKDDKTIKYFIHTNDFNRILEDEYNWCDIYGCVNTNYANFQIEKYPKLVSLCPSFGIIPDTKLFAWRMAFCCFVNAYKNICGKKEWCEKQFNFIIDKRNNIKHYWTRFFKGIKSRPYYEEYSSKESMNGYIFFLSTLWYSNEYNKNDDGVNLRRANFIRACKELELEGKCVFEGGFADRSASTSQNLFSDCICSALSMKDWMKKSHKSSIVFNTPAFWDCHGWKLGEYLAMGKCIVSTKPVNDLPIPLVHGENIHFVEDDKDSIKQAVEYILSHPAYQHKLENGAYNYWLKYGTPAASLKLLKISN